MTVKYGSRLRELFARPGGEGLRARIDAMSNEEYQRLLVADPAELRERLPGEHAALREDVRRIVHELDDHELLAAIRDLGGHDLGDLLAAFREADAASDRPSVVFAYTIKGWRLPIEGHPGNHSALLTQEQWEELARSVGADAEHPWAGFDDDSDEARLCADAAERLSRVGRDRAPGRPACPPTSGGATPRRSRRSRRSAGSSTTWPARRRRPRATS